MKNRIFATFATSEMLQMLRMLQNVANVNMLRISTWRHVWRSSADAECNVMEILSTFIDGYRVKFIEKLSHFCNIPMLQMLQMLQNVAKCCNSRSEARNILFKLWFITPVNLRSPTIQEKQKIRLPSLQHFDRIFMIFGIS